ncbi:MAG TPA: ABC transporter ATP-binding protein, partial [Armatimonadota bacterium]|nr:ABC transporter ATP-binding protein [Armatimonadota bacterium]
MKSLRRLASFMKPFWVSALLAPLLMALEVSMDLSQPHLMQSIVDVGIARHDLNYVLHTGLHMIFVALTGMVGGVGCTIFATIAGLHFGTAIRDRLFTKIQQLSFGNLDRLQTGGLITRITNDVDQVQEAALMFLRILVRAPLLTIGSLIMAAITAPKLSLLLIIIGPILIALLMLVNQKAHPLFTTVQNCLDRVNTTVQENLAGVRVVKAFVRSTYESERFNVANEALSQQTVRASSVVAGMMPGMMILLNFGIAAALWFGGVSVHHGNLHVGQLIAFVNYLLQMLSSLMMVGMMLMRVSRADASAERIIEVLESEPEVCDVPEAIDAPVSQGRVEFAHVDFSYDGPAGSPVLSDISFTAEPGHTVAILGATGSGKSTLVHLIARLYDATAGRILLDGMDVRSMTQDTLRQHIAIVLQQTVLFSGTIRDNLRYGRPDATDAEIEAAARMAHAHDFIISFPDGYDSVLGQSGVNISGGQKQRLSIARALIARPTVLILDDCTSAVDMATEASIMSSLQSWSHVCTRIVVAQRIGAVINADTILLLDSGRLVATGTHSELLRSSAVYQDI